MRFVFRILQIFVLSLTSYVNTYSQKTIEADTNRLVIDGSLYPFSQISPGDTIRLLPGTRPFIILKNLNGTDESPIVICNGNGDVIIDSDHYFGISIRKSSHIKLTGKGYPHATYGIKIYNRTGSGLSIGDYTTFFEIECIEVGYSQFAGIVAKTEPFCGFDRSSFIQENTFIHDCWVHHCGTEGMYIGSSFYKGQVIQCDSVPATVLPPLLKNVEVYNNLIEYSGWDGIQVSSAINARIHHNIIRYDSQEMADWQMNGIILGEGSTGHIYNNEISDGEGSGIFSNGLGDIFIYNNKIIRPGKNNQKASGQYGIYLDEKSAITGMYFYVFNNLVLNPKLEGIRLLSYYGKKKNKILNNILIKEDFQPFQEEVNLINIIGEKVTTGSNFITSDIALLQFRDPSCDNYQLEPGSLLIDAGQQIAFIGQLTDFNNKPRNQGYGIDIGPYESEYSREQSIASLEKEKAYPNPLTPGERTTICFNNPVEGWVDFCLVNHNGSELKKLGSNYYTEGRQFKVIAGNDLIPGMNFIQIRKRMENSIIRISLIDH